MSRDTTGGHRPKPGKLGSPPNQGGSATKPALAPVPERLPTAEETATDAVGSVIRFYAAMRTNAEEIAKTRFCLYTQYVKAGFTPDDALKLAGGSLLL